jgi:hydrogenase maturation protease
VRALVIGFGNPGRMDDGLGPALAEKVESWQKPSVVALADYQLNIEHAAEVAESDLVIFIDASTEATPPFCFYRLEPANRQAFTTHAMVPETVLETCRKVYGKAPPAFILAVRGDRFELGEGLSSGAKQNMEKSEKFLSDLLQPGDLTARCMGAAGC